MKERVNTKGEGVKEGVKRDVRSEMGSKRVS